MDGFEKKQNASLDVHTEKQKLRSRCKSLLAHIPGDDRRWYEFDLRKNLEAFLYEKVTNQSIWASYMPMATEANPHVDISTIQWVYPRIVGEEMQFYMSTQGAAFEPSQWGVLEPAPTTSTEIQKQKIQGMLIPGLAFSKAGKRLGRGKAYYDKYLKDFKGLKVGLAFQLQVQEDIPFEEHDVTMDYIVTNESTITCEVVNG